MRDGLDYNSELEYVKKLDQKPVPEPAEYTCPRCESNVSTHICMGVDGETKPLTEWDFDIPADNRFNDPFARPAPAVAAPAEGKRIQHKSGFWEEIWELQDRWKKIWDADRAKFKAEYPKWMVDAASEIFAHDMCDAWSWNEYVEAATVILHRHYVAASTPPPAATVTRDLEGKLRELAVCGIYHGFSPECSHCAARLILAREAAALGRAEGFGDSLKIVREFTYLDGRAGELANLLVKRIEAIRALKEKV